MDESQGRRGRDGEVEVGEFGQKNKEDVASKNTCKVGLLGKIGNKVEKERIGEGHGMEPKGGWRDGEVEVEEVGQNNKEDVASKNICKVGLLGKIGN